MARNRRAGRCYRCGERVNIGDGHFELVRHTKRFRTQHALCAIAYRGTDVAYPERTGVRPKTEAEAESIFYSNHEGT